MVAQRCVACAAVRPRMAGGAFWARVEACDHQWTLCGTGELRCRLCRAFDLDGTLSGWSAGRWRSHWKNSKPLLAPILRVPQRPKETRPA